MQEEDYVEDENSVGDREETTEDEEVIEEESSSEEDSSEEPSSDEQSDSSAPEEKEKSDKKYNRVPAKTRINQIQRKRYRAENEANQLRAQLQEAQKQIDNLKHVSEQSNQAAMYSYDKSIQAQIDKAVFLKTQAIESGDVQAQVEADRELARAVAQQVNMDAWKAQQETRVNTQRVPQPPEPQKQQRSYVPDEPEFYTPPEAEDWISENTWFDENHDDFDPELFEKASNYARHLDRRYDQSGNGHLKLSESYFNEMNRYMSKFIGNQSQPRTQQQPRGGLVMNQSRAPVSPVGRGPTPSSAKNQRINLSTEEKEMARNLGWTDETWIKMRKKSVDDKIGMNPARA